MIQKILFLSLFLFGHLLIAEEIEKSVYYETFKIALEVAKRAGEELVKVRASGEDLQIQYLKDYDGRLIPETIADQRSNELICKGLVASFPSYGLITQNPIEDVSVQKAIENWRTSEFTWVIDALDGTQTYIEGGDEFGIHIGLTKDGESILGINHFPLLDITYYAIKGCGAYKQKGKEPPQRIRVQPSNGIIAPIYATVAPINQKIYEALLGKGVMPEQFPKVGSCGLRICSVADGTYNLYVSSGVRGWIWDFCSAEIVMREAGGFISDLKGNPLDFRSDNMKLKQGAVVCSDLELYKRVLSSAY